MAPNLAPRRTWVKIYMCSDLVGMAGFEPATSCSQSRRANQAAPHPADRSVAYRPTGYRLSVATAPSDGAYLRDVYLAVGPSPAVAVLRSCALAGTLSVLSWRGSGPHAGRAGVAQWQSPSLPSWS